LDDIPLGDADTLRNQLDLVGPQIPFLEGEDLALRLPQVEEQLLLVRRSDYLYQRPRAQDVFLNRRPDPPHGIGGQAEAFFRLEMLGRLDEPDISFRDDLGDRQTVGAVTHGDFGDEA
jgi:hypothetical protein